MLLIEIIKTQTIEGDSGRLGKSVIWNVKINEKL